MLDKIDARVRSREQTNLFFEQILKVLETTYDNSETYISIKSSKMFKDYFYILFTEIYTGKNGKDRYLTRKCLLKHIDKGHAVYLFEKIGKKLYQRGHLLCDFPGRGTKNTIKRYKIS